MLTTLSPRLYLAIDAGSTHTEAILSDESGFQLGRSILEYGTNLHNTAPDHLYQLLLKVADAARENANFVHPKRMQDAPVHTVCIGMAGFDTEKDHQKVMDFIKKLDKDSPLVTVKKLIFVSNSQIGFKSGTEARAGICINVGTGSSCYGVALDGREVWAGGWGYFLGDQGSGYWIGRAILRQVMREYDGRAATTTLSHKACVALGLADAAAMVGWAYADEKLPIAEVARLSYLVNDPELEDSVELSRIINESVGDIVDAYKAVLSRLQLGTTPKLPVVFTGGLFRMKGGYLQKVLRAVASVTPGAELIQPSMTPAQGGIRLIQQSEAGESLPRSALVVINPSKVLK
jgi:N-acetylglucosamine kinase-like BadF-type ATPase